MWLRLAVSSALPASSAAVAVTVCAVFQLLVVNVSVVWVPEAVLVSAVTSVLSLATVTVTLALGWRASATV